MKLTVWPTVNITVTYLKMHSISGWFLSWRQNIGKYSCCAKETKRKKSGPWHITSQGFTGFWKRRTWTGFIHGGDSGVRTQSQAGVISYRGKIFIKCHRASHCCTWAWVKVFYMFALMLSVWAFHIRRYNGIVQRDSSRTIYSKCYISIWNKQTSKMYFVLKVVG